MQHLATTMQPATGVQPAGFASVKKPSSSGDGVFTVIPISSFDPAAVPFGNVTSSTTTVSGGSSVPSSVAGNSVAKSCDGKS